MLWGDFTMSSQRWWRFILAGVVVTKTENHSPFGVSAAFARISPLISAMFFTPPTGGEERSSCVAAMRPAETKWLCPSMKPGEHGPPAQIRNHRMRIGLRAMISASEPTARMVSPVPRAPAPDSLQNP